VTQDDLSAAVGLSRVTVSRTELGRHAVSVTGLLGIARALGVPPAHLLDPAAGVKPAAAGA
jgi:transcriptional regulator with XRE-family HTH domain